MKKILEAQKQISHHVHKMNVLQNSKSKMTAPLGLLNDGIKELQEKQKKDKEKNEKNLLYLNESLNEANLKIQKLEKELKELKTKGA